MDKRNNYKTTNVLSGVLACLIAVFTIFTIFAQRDVAGEEENYCQVFSNQDISNFHMYFMSQRTRPDGFTSDDIVTYTWKKNYDDLKYDPDGDAMYIIPAKDLEAAASQLFVFDNIKDSSHYNASTDTYDIGGFGGAGGGPSYFLEGYTSDGNNEYTLYFKMTQAFWGTDIPALIQEYSDYVGHDLTAMEQADWLYKFTNGNYAFISPEDHQQMEKIRLRRTRTALLPR